MSGRRAPRTWLRETSSQPIVVIDDLFDDVLVRMVAYSLRRLPFTLSEYDTEATRHVPHWSSELDLDKPPVVPVMGELIQGVLGAPQDVYDLKRELLHRIHCNLHRFGDEQYPHTDSPGGATAIYFANAHWQRDWGGETIFYEDDEALHAVIPRPGRVVIFAADMVHRGGVPARGADPRLALAFKFVRPPQACA